MKENEESVINASETSSLLLFKWFYTNIMKANSDKSHLHWSCFEASTVVTDGCSIKPNIREVLMGIRIDKNVKFDDHGKNLCKKVCKKLNAISRFLRFFYISHVLSASRTLAKENNCESFHRISVRVLPVSLDVPLSES